MLWAVFIAFLACAAHLRRLGWQDELARSIVSEARSAAEHGAQVQVGDGGGEEGPSGAYVWLWQGPAIYLLERGRDYPELERTLLLLEARRSYDAIYLYPNCFNWDLRQALITRCAAAYPQDPAVAWAAGRLLLTCGAFEQAASWQKRALDLGVDAKSLGVKEEHIVGRYVTTLVLLDRAKDAEAFLAQRAKAEPNSGNAQYAYLDFLCKSDRYDEVLKLAKEAAARFPGDACFMDLRRRAAKWSGRIDEYRELVRATLPPGAGQAAVYKAAPWLAVYDKSPMADKLLSWPSPEAFRAYADVCALDWRPELIARLAKQRDLEWDSVQSMRNSSNNYDEIQKHQSLLASAKVQMTRAFVLSSKAVGAGPAIRSDPDSLAPEWRAPSREELARGPALRSAPGLPAPEWYWAPTLEELASWRAGITAEAWRLLEATAHGKKVDKLDIAQLGATGRLVSILVSRGFSDALKAGGRKRADVLAEVRKAVTPDRDTYYDYSNGSLSWPVEMQSPKEPSAKQ